MADCSVCGWTVHCAGGCGLICHSNCEHCSYFCSETHLSQQEGTGGVLIWANRKTGDLHIGVGTPVELPELEMPSYSDQEEIRLCFHDLPRASLAHLLGNHLGHTVRAAAGEADERISGSDEGTVAELAAKYSLILE
jgi:hypothetical protein